MTRTTLTIEESNLTDLEAEERREYNEIMQQQLKAQFEVRQKLGLELEENEQTRSLSYQISALQLASGKQQNFSTTRVMRRARRNTHADGTDVHAYNIQLHK